jgi:hypothetical protein
VATKRKTVQYAWVLLKAVIIGILAVVLWRWGLYAHGYYFNTEAELPIFYMIIPPVGFIYVIFASLAVNSVFEQYKIIQRSVVRNDLDTYLEHRDERLPGLMHILVSVPSVVLLFLVMTYQYIDKTIGIVAVFSVTLVISLTWLVIVELDNVPRRYHFKKKVPEKWHEKDPKDHFSK